MSVMRWAAGRATILLWAVVMMGCFLGRPAPETRYYTLEVAEVLRVKLGAPVRVTLFTTDPAYAKARIAYRSSPYRLDYYNYHRWAGDPRALVTAAVRDYFQVSARDFEGVPLTIEGHIRRIEEVDEPAGWKGLISVSLTAKRGGVVLLQRTYAEEEPTKTRGPEAVVAALSRALGRILDEFSEELSANPAAAATVDVR